jgi:hypothetical protein
MVTDQGCCHFLFFLMKLPSFFFLWLLSQSLNVSSSHCRSRLSFLTNHRIQFFFAKHRRVSRALVGADLAAKDLKMSAKARRRSLSAEGVAAAPVRDSLLPGDAGDFQVGDEVLWANDIFYTI